MTWDCACPRRGVVARYTALGSGFLGVTRLGAPRSNRNSTGHEDGRRLLRAGEPSLGAWRGADGPRGPGPVGHAGGVKGRRRRLGETNSSPRSRTRGWGGQPLGERRLPGGGSDEGSLVGTGGDARGWGLASASAGFEVGLMVQGMFLTRLLVTRRCWAQP